ncbi:hypothetical protein OMK64_15225 [Cellulomonas fimi]|uniref:hypothetical protein n=1 Tax=Cellulomonas fimi TaxID=1708 RepID=UPI00234C8A1C|nr:hypothetical protein [Cellulomonas fimi]MDC7122886.1 hypothetical protein [Cellulomonas fimi]
MRDLDELLASTETTLARAAGPGGPVPAPVRSGIRRRRVVRHAAESLVAVVAVGAVASAAWIGAGHAAPVPAVSPTSDPTPTTSAPAPTAPAPSPSEAADDGPVVRETALADDVVLRRLLHPRTGESWTTPVAVDDGPALVSRPDTWGSATTFRVGARGDATIYAVANHLDYDGVAVLGLFEVDGAGARFIACPGPRAEEECADPAAVQLADGVTVDRDTFYDSLGVPGSLELGDGFVVTTTEEARWAHELLGSPARTDLGDARLLTGENWYGVSETVRVLGRFGAGAVVETRTPGQVAGLTNVDLAWRTPFGSLVELAAGDVPGGDFNAIVWDDGVERRSARDDLGVRGGDSQSPAAPHCFAPGFAVEDSPAPAAWRPAGRTADGRRVYVRASADALVHAVRGFHEEHSATVVLPDDPTSTEDAWVRGAEAYAATGFTTDQAFVDAHALYAVDGPGGVRYLALRRDAANLVYECA